MGKRTHTITMTVGSLSEPMRLDAYVVESDPRLSRSLFSRPDTQITVNDKAVKKSRLVKGGDRIVVTYTEEFFEGLVAQPMELSVLYEDDHVLIIDKEEGVVVHPGAGNWDHTLAHALVARYGPNFTTEGDTTRPGIVHRLDKDTSGVLIIAKNGPSHRNLARQFKDRGVEKVYVALVKGHLGSKSGSIEANIKRHPTKRKVFTTCSDDEGRTARTDYRVVAQGRGWSMVRIELFTGRTHQIRVHLASIGHPIIGDAIYGGDDRRPLMLHALILGIDHPVSGVRLRAIAPLPKRIKDWVYEPREFASRR